MAKANPTIAPFPDDIDREAFGHWLSGFTDGEGSFVLNLYRHASNKGYHHAVAYFRIKLRDDDLSILELIQSYWGCGVISHFGNHRSKVPNAKPTASLTVASIRDSVSAVVPHFLRFPLRAKKQRDFSIWKEAVELCASIQSRPVQVRRNSSSGGFSGTIQKWAGQERERFASLSDLLRDQRRYANGPSSACSHRISRPAEDQSLLWQ